MPKHESPWDPNEPIENCHEYIECRKCEKMTAVMSRNGHCQYCGVEFYIEGLMHGTEKDWAIRWFVDEDRIDNQN